MKLAILTALLLAAPLVKAGQKTLIDFFLPMEPRNMVSEGIWGADPVLPRDIDNGLEDPTMKNWCYWDGSIVKDDTGRYHMYASRWSQAYSHSVGWNKQSRGLHSVSDSLFGPYKDLGETWPHWNNGAGHNVVGLRMHDGRYALISSEVTPGNVFVSSSPDGPFEHLGEFIIDPNGFYEGWARYDELDDGAVRAGVLGHLSNVMIILRPDGRYMMLARHCVPMISDDGILGPYKMLNDRVWEGLKNMPQFKNEDPTIWYSDGLYHIVVNHHGGGDITYHLTSEDGIHNWTNRGLAFHKAYGVFRYTDGTRNDWNIVQRPTVYTENGMVKAFNFSVIDVHKGKDRGNDNHGSKIIVVPFDGTGFSKHIRSIVNAENAQVDATPPPSPWKSVDLGSVKKAGNTGFNTAFNTFRIQSNGGLSEGRLVYQKMEGDISARVLVLSQDISAESVLSGLMFRESLNSDARTVSAVISKSDGLLFEHSGTPVSKQKLKAPYWLRMEKRGQRITAYISSSNKMNWEKIGETTVDLGNEFYAGLYAHADGAAKKAVSRFKDADFHVWGEPLSEGIINHTFPDRIPASGKIRFEVEYENRQALDVFAELQNVHTTKKLKALRRQMPSKKNTLELTYDAGPLQPGDIYWFVLKSIPIHGHENRAIQHTYKKVTVE
ncbi:glycoside hydrolase family protein [Pontiella agarivorans]|uniref:Glycoside hydrolase family protein n=1 Tax=Pontiella agarivorans TaxID=3038953 RepID=A0ABU5MU57_9BACT|nr:glycoside hydrolase family protein [Pontiella agarivorans]MDZ8117631.1 glycoside hydrolase family protein [Pontiella agarivorans]